MSHHFTHLHVHTDYSLLDGAITIEKLIQFGKSNQCKALAISDHGNIFGAVKFFQQCKKAGIKPILAMEAYLTEDATIKIADKKYYHLLIIVQNDIGYKNLCKLISFSYQQGFYFKPRIDYRILEQYNEGLLVTSACLGGHIPQLLMDDNISEATRYTEWFLRVFGPERFYLEIQPEDQKAQAVLNQKLYEWSAQKGIPLVATGDCHYPSLADHEAHEVMLAIQTHDKIDNSDRYTFGDCRVYLRTQDEMLHIFKEHEQAVWNTGVIADTCTFEFETGKLFFPQFEIPHEHTPETYFKHLCITGFEQLKTKNRIPLAQEMIYKERLDLEIELIISMGFVGYFLVVSDFIQWARRNKIPVGPGRGSAAGSLVAWTLEITNIDPIRYNLLFERFLNPERVTMPDIDIDFCIEGREKVIDYVRSKYGHDKVCQIITFGTMLAKGVIKDVARALGFPFEDSNAITNLIPEQLKITLAQAFEQEPRLKELMDNNPRAKKLFDIAFRLEGLTRHASKHAAGIVISPQPVDEVLPLYIPSKSTELVTQYAMTELESLGFLKMDLLGLKNLTLIDRVVTSIAKSYGVSLDIDMIDLEDTKTFELLCQGKTSGVFQLESDGLKEVLRKLQPEKFEDIIAVNALYRPGPLGSGMVDDFIARKHGQQKITYIFDELEPILQETYGVIVYQEQVMKIASAIAGYSLGESDILRRAMGKKKAEVMAEQREIFLTRAQERNFNGKKAGELFDLMAYFAGYGFNKSHSAAYALIAYQTAYLKANYPAEFMACLISLEADNAEKMTFYLQEAKDMGLTVLPPDINHSAVDFTALKDQLLFGLRGIKNVGLTALENIIQERTKSPFVDLLDFCMRIDLRTANKRVIEHLICAGALDSFPGNRAQKTEELPLIMERALAKKRALLTGQLDLFGSRPESTPQTGVELYHYQPRPEWTDKEKLEKENAVMGFYVSAHPLDAYKKYLQWCSCPSFQDILTDAQASLPSEKEREVIVCGIVKSRKDIVTKKGERMSFLQLEDMSATAEIVIFPKLFKKVEAFLENHTAPFLVKGTVDSLASTQKCKIKAIELAPIDVLFEHWSTIETVLYIPQSVDALFFQTLQSKFSSGTRSCAFIFEEEGKRFKASIKQKISLDGTLIQELEALNITISLRL
jgi:DNA polymerase III subunit alpha